LHNVDFEREIMLRGCRRTPFVASRANFRNRRVHSQRVRPSRNSDKEELLKKTGFLTLFIMATLVFALAFPAAAAGPKAAAAPARAAVVAPAAPAAVAPVPERHPHIDETLESMRPAKHHLESVEHDFDGHRMKAMEHLNQAIHEAELCMSMR
jgi:uncharacterized membrane protein